MAYPSNAYSNHDRYLESEILSADPVKLVLILFRAGIEATAAARRHLAEGSIHARARQVVKAWEILQELSRSLDHQAAAEISKPLADLYAYMQRRLLDANLQQIDAPLAEVERLLTTLLEAWSSVTVTQPQPELRYESVSCTY